MTRRTDEDFARLLAASILGAGVGGLAATAYQSNEDRRAWFTQRLADELAKHGLQFLSAAFGRAAGNVPVWLVTLQDPFDGVRQVQVRLPRGTAPYEEATCAQVAEAVVAEAA
jgi:hypothetical protein